MAMTSASHAEGRQFDPGQVYFCCSVVVDPVSSSGWDVGLWRQARKCGDMAWTSLPEVKPGLVRHSATSSQPDDVDTADLPKRTGRKKKRSEFQAQSLRGATLCHMLGVIETLRLLFILAPFHSFPVVQWSVLAQFPGAEVWGYLHYLERRMLQYRNTVPLVRLPILQALAAKHR